MHVISPVEIAWRVQAYRFNIFYFNFLRPLEANSEILEIII